MGGKCSLHLSAVRRFSAMFQRNQDRSVPMNLRTERAGAETLIFRPSTRPWYVARMHVDAQSRSINFVAGGWIPLSIVDCVRRVIPYWYFVKIGTASLPTFLLVAENAPASGLLQSRLLSFRLSEPRRKADNKGRLNVGWRMDRGVSQQEWQVAGDSRPAFSACEPLMQPSSAGIHRGPPARRAPMDASRRRQDKSAEKDLTQRN